MPAALASILLGKRRESGGTRPQLKLAYPTLTPPLGPHSHAPWAWIISKSFGTIISYGAVIGEQVVVTAGNGMMGDDAAGPAPSRTEKGGVTEP